MAHKANFTRSFIHCECLVGSELEDICSIKDIAISVRKHIDWLILIFLILLVFHIRHKLSDFKGLFFLTGIIEPSMYGPHLASMMTLAPFKGESDGDTLLAMDLIEDIDKAL